MNVDDWPRWRLGLFVGVMSVMVFVTTLGVLEIRGIDGEPVASRVALPTSTSSTSTSTTTTLTASEKTTTLTSATTTIVAAAPSSLAAQIAVLAVADERRDGYDRDLFEHWSDADGDGCNTRAEVLEAESLEPVTRNANNCTVLTGRWHSAYDGQEATDAQDIDIDHVVALAEAWDSGAWAWDPARREAFANDLDHGYALIAVTDNSNQSKSDRDPAEWMPQRTNWCDYLTAWVSMKTVWELSIDTTEKRALEVNAAAC